MDPIRDDFDLQISAARVGWAICAFLIRFDPGLGPSRQHRDALKSLAFVDFQAFEITRLFAA